MGRMRKREESRIMPRFGLGKWNNEVRRTGDGEDWVRTCFVENNRNPVSLLDVHMDI